MAAPSITGTAGADFESVLAQLRDRTSQPGLSAQSLVRSLRRFTYLCTSSQHDSVATFEKLDQHGRVIELLNMVRGPTCAAECPLRYSGAAGRGA